MKSILEENFHISSREVEELFKKLDTDNDQEIEYTEFLAAALQGRVKVHQDLLSKTFARFDNSSTGYISVSDLKTVLGEKFEDTEIEELIKEADTDHDGNINYEEFVRYFSRDTVAADAPEGMEPAGSMRSVALESHREKIGQVVDGLVVENEGRQHKSLMSKGNKVMTIGGM